MLFLTFRLIVVLNVLIEKCVLGGRLGFHQNQYVLALAFYKLEFRMSSNRMSHTFMSVDFSHWCCNLLCFARVTTVLQTHDVGRLVVLCVRLHAVRVACYVMKSTCQLVHVVPASGCRLRVDILCDFHSC